MARARSSQKEQGKKGKAREGDPSFRKDLGEVDPETRALIDYERDRQNRKIILIASESICPPAVREAEDSEFTNIYAEGYPSTRMRRHERDRVMEIPRHLSFFHRYSDRRYYKGTEYANFVETLAIRRVAEAFATDGDPKAAVKVSPGEIYPNVQPLSGAAANNAVYDAFVEPGGVVMGMSLTHGGHLTHGSPYNRSGKHFRIVPYRADPATGKIDFDALREKAAELKPRMIIAGYSAYPWDIDWKAFREVCDSLPGGAILMADIAHIAGLVAAGVCASPLPYADVVTFTTHKTLLGPRGAVILTTDPDKAKKVDVAVFPGEQGGPHVNNIAAKAVSFRIAQSDEFRALQERIAENARTLCEAFVKRGYRIAYGGTNTHLLLIDLSRLQTKGEVGLNAEIAARILDIAGLVCNKNSIPGDRSAMNPSGLRFGTTFVSQRGMGPREMEKIAGLVHKVLSEVHSFRVIGNRGPIGRGKVPFGVIEEVAREVEALQAATMAGPADPILGYPHYPYREGPSRPEGAGSRTSTPDEEDRALRERAVLCDLTERGIIEVSGERSLAFLQGLLTCDLSGLEVGGVRRGFLLDGEGRSMADVTVLHTALPGAGPSAYLLTLHDGDVEEVKRWLRAHSDGYVLFEPEDVFAKVEGPVVVGDPRTGPAPLVRLGLFGSKAAEAVSALEPTLRDLDPGLLHRGRWDGVEGVALRDGPTGMDGFEFLIPADGAESLRTRLLSNGGIIPAGIGLLDRQKGERPHGDRPKGESLYRAGLEDRFSLSKTYFVGRRALLAALEPKGRKKEEFSWSEPKGPPRKTALHEEHGRLTKQRNMVSFAGWEMPVQYTSIIEEHQAVREAAGLFDVAHMGVLEISGEGATSFLNLVTTNFLTPLRPGTCQYNYVMDPWGKVMDDVVVYRLEAERYMMIVNAANQEKIKAWFDGVSSGKYLIDPDHPAAAVDRQVAIRDLKDPSSGGDRRVDMALQGPVSLEVLLRISDRDEDRTCLHCLHRSQFGRVRLAGAETIVSRSGYTGEPLGFEIYAHPDDTPHLWRAILDAGADIGVLPVGLGARDSTRTQAGFPLYGRELGGPHDIVPMEAGYGAFVKRHKPFFVGKRAALDREAQRTMEVIRFRVVSSGGRMVKAESPVVDRTGRAMGVVTSCAKVGEAQVGLAWVERTFRDPGTKIGVFALPRAEKVPPGKSILDLSLGDRVTLHDDAVVLTRFYKPGEV